MRRAPEIVVLVVLLLASIAGVLWYVIDRRSKLHATPPPVAASPLQPAPVAAGPVPRPLPSPALAVSQSGPIPVKSAQPGPGPVPVMTATPSGGPVPVASTEPVPLGGPNERKTIDFSGGKAVVKDSVEDQAAIDAALKDMNDATKNVTFEPTKKPAAPAKP